MPSVRFGPQSDGRTRSKVAAGQKQTRSPMSYAAVLTSMMLRSGSIT